MRLAAVLIVVGAIALSCTDAAGRWCGHAFNLGLGRLLAYSSANTFWTVRFIAEKSVHLILFAGLATALFCCLHRFPHRVIWTVVAGFGVGCCSELFQRVFPTRDPTLRDVMINWFGVLIGVGCIHLVQRFISFSPGALVASESHDITRRSLAALAAHLQPHEVASEPHEHTMPVPQSHFLP